MAKLDLLKDSNNKIDDTRRSDWNHQCDALNCPLKPSALIGGAQLCFIHNGTSPGEGFQNWNNISYVINNELGLIKKISGLTLKTSEFWSNPTQLNALHGWEFCPLGKNEETNIYIQRLTKTLETFIKNKAETLGAN